MSFPIFLMLLETALISDLLKFAEFIPSVAAVIPVIGQGIAVIGLGVVTILGFFFGVILSVLLYIAGARGAKQIATMAVGTMIDIIPGANLFFINTLTVVITYLITTFEKSRLGAEITEKAIPKVKGVAKQLAA